MRRSVMSTALALSVAPARRPHRAFSGRLEDTPFRAVVTSGGSTVNLDCAIHIIR